ncbi:MAG TPA: hypothetical protein VLA46_09135 [Saprospiraceae bacterium]|nr:hypothetical protein [Saprospiraceae bacterium]
MVKSKLLNILLIFTSLFGYLEWGGDNHSFLFQAEGEVLSKIFTDPASVLHPLTVLPMIGQMLLLITLFQKKPGKILTYAGLAGLGILLSFILLVGALSLNFKIMLSAVPFLVLAVITILHYRKMNPNHLKQQPD